MGVLAGILILSYYSVDRWLDARLCSEKHVRRFRGASAAVSRLFSVTSPGSWVSVTSAHLFMGINIFVVARGVERGLEKAVRFMVPALLLLMLTLLGYSITSGSFGRGLTFMFTPDFEALAWDSVLAAMGQAFFYAEHRHGRVMAYGAYLPRGNLDNKRGQPPLLLRIAAYAILAGLVIFPMVFANGLDPASRTRTCLRDTLPLAFGQMTGGVFSARCFSSC